MKNILLSFFGRKIIRNDIISSNNFVDLSIQRMKEAGREANLPLAYADGLQTVSRLLSKHYNIDERQVLCANDIDKDQLDAVYRHLLFIAEKASAKINSPSDTDQYEAVVITFAAVALSFLYRLKWLELVLMGSVLADIKLTTKNIETLIYKVSNFAFDAY